MNDSQHDDVKNVEQILKIIITICDLSHIAIIINFNSNLERFQLLLHCIFYPTAEEEGLLMFL